MGCILLLVRCPCTLGMHSRAACARAPCLLLGVLAVKRVGGVPTVFPADSGEVAPGEDLLQVTAACPDERAPACLLAC